MMSVHIDGLLSFEKIIILLSYTLNTEINATVSNISEKFQQKHKNLVIKLLVRTINQNFWINQIEKLILDEEEPKELQKLLELAVEWNCVDGAHDLFQQIPVL